MNSPSDSAAWVKLFVGTNTGKLAFHYTKTNHCTDYTCMLLSLAIPR